jgi:hypothetical protein
MSSKKCFATSILIIIPLCTVHIARSVFSIESFNRHRDQDAVEKILSHDAKAVAYCPIRFATDLADQNKKTDVIRTNNTVVGVIQYFTDRGSDLSLDYKRFGYIRLLAVDKAYRNKG